MTEDYSGLQKAAILLITLGPEKASVIFQHLKEEEIQEELIHRIKKKFLKNFIRYVLRSSILLKVVLDMQKRYLKKHLEMTELRVLLLSLQLRFRFAHLSLFAKQNQASC